MKHYRGVFRRLAGVVVLLFAIDLAAITTLGKKADTTFQQVGMQVSAQGGARSVAAPSSDYAGAVILVLGIAAGLGLYSWGDAASRQLQQQQRAALANSAVQADP